MYGIGQKAFLVSGLMSESVPICRRCGRIYDKETGIRTGDLVFDEHARGGSICVDCLTEMEVNKWPNG